MPREYEVEKLCGKRFRPDGQPEFLVLWKGFTKQTWEPVANLSNSNDLVKEFERQLINDAMPKETTTTALRSREVTRKTGEPKSSGRSNSAGRKPAQSSAGWARDKSPVKTRSRSRSRGRPPTSKKEVKSEPKAPATRRQLKKDEEVKKTTDETIYKTPKETNGGISSTKFYGSADAKASNLVTRMSREAISVSPSKISVSSTESAKISPPKTITQDGSPRSKALPNGDSPKSSTVKSIETNEVEPKKNRFWFVSFALLVGCLLVIAVALLMEDRREQFKEVFNELKKKTAELFPSK